MNIDMIVRGSIVHRDMWIMNGGYTTRLHQCVFCDCKIINSKSPIEAGASYEHVECSVCTMSYVVEIGLPGPGRCSIVAQPILADERRFIEVLGEENMATLLLLTTKGEKESPFKLMYDIYIHRLTKDAT